jgi:putative CocE/NonD family hydrolase
VDLNIADSIVRARYRKNPAKAEFLTPRQPEELTIEMYPTSLVFQRGHRIRVDISSSNFPRFDVNPNTGEPLNNNRRWQIAENSVYFGGSHASQIVCWSSAIGWICQSVRVGQGHQRIPPIIPDGAVRVPGF